MPPVNRMMLKATMPMRCAPVASSNWMPSPSVPKHIPANRNINNVGTPKR